MNMDTILVVDDEIEIRRLIRLHLEQSEMNVVEAGSGNEAIACLKSHSISLVILDLMMEEGTGFEVLHYLQDAATSPLVIIISAKGEIDNKILTFGLGADDYVTKPFSPMELVARVKAQLRRHRPHSLYATNIIKLNKFILDINNLSLINEHKSFPLTPVECKLLEYFFQNPDRILTKRDIYKYVWMHDNFDGNNLSVYISKLRAMLEPHEHSPHYIHSIRGIGYRFSGDGQ